MSLFGHDEAIGAFDEARGSGRMHHAWLLTGPQGVGKARFAALAALRLLADAAGPRIDAPGLSVPDEHPVARLIAAGSHPDIRTLSRLAREGSGELARNINVAQVRGLQGLFGVTPGLSPWRVVIIDAADDLERNAANALLKNLEEPPADSLFLLVSHAPGRLLPTIRSRCRVLRFSSLGDADMAAALGLALPDSERAEHAVLARLGQGAPGRAMRFAGLEIAALDAALDALAAGGDPDNARRSALARQLSGKAAQARYEMFLERAPSHIAAVAKRRRGAALAEALALWEKARGLAESAVRLSLDPQATVFELAGLLASLARSDLALDRSS